MVNRVAVARRVAFVLVLGAIVIVPFMLLGEDFGKSWLTDTGRGRAWVMGTGVLLLTVDAVLPIPSSWVMIALANQAGVFAGIIAGTVGLTTGVVLAAWIGRTAVGPLASRIVPAADLERLRSGAPRQVIIGLVCLRSIPVLAEMSVLAAAAAKVPLSRILLATVPANLVIAVVYSLAADESLTAATVVFVVSVVVSYALWRSLNRS